MLTSASVGVASLLGRRHTNQDRAYALAPWAFVLDGVGGSQRGGDAAQIAMATLLSQLAKLQSGRDVDHDLLRILARTAHTSVNEELAGTGTTTMTLVHLLPLSPTLTSVQLCAVGDSPAWIVSHDATPVQIFTPKSQGNLLDSALGLEPFTHHVSTASLIGDGRIVLATDGINALPATQRDGIMANSRLTAQDCASLLAHKAIHSGGTDNTTIIVLDLARTPLEHSNAPLALPT